MARKKQDWSTRLTHVWSLVISGNHTDVRVFMTQQEAMKALDKDMREQLAKQDIAAGKKALILKLLGDRLYEEAAHAWWEEFSESYAWDELPIEGA